MQQKEQDQYKVFDLLQQSADGVFILNHDWQLVEADARFAKTLKHTSLKLPLPFEMLCDKPEEFRQIQQFLGRKRLARNVEITLKSKWGKRVFCELSLSRHAHQTEHKQYLGVLYNITKRKTAEKELLQVEKLLAAGKLSRVLAHEVRNPLTNIQLALEQIRDEVDVPDADLYFDIIERNSKRIGSLISSLLNSSKPMVLQRKEDNINTLVQSAVDLVKDRLSLAQIKLSLDLSDKSPKAWVDGEQLTLALVNIMINAIEAMQPGKGKLVVRSANKKHSVTVVIEDNGHGLSEDEIDLLFEPFYSNKRKGTGLGLTTVQNIVQSHNGKIEVTSKLNKRTRFTITLPKR